MKTAYYLEVTLKIDDDDRSAAAELYVKYKKPVLDTISGALSKELLLREDDVQVLLGFAAKGDAEGYLESKLFNEDIVTDLKPYLKADPEIRIYEIFPSE